MSTESRPELEAEEDYSVRNDDGSSNPQSIGKYRIERKLGAGGMGTVYLATDMELRRRVALKVLPRERSENPTLIKRFRAEAQAAATLEHKHVVKVYETGQADGYTYIAMEYVDGIDVHDLVHRREMIPVKRSIDIVKQVAAALEHAHEKGIIHRDIKPSNLLIQRDGTVKLADLGLARSLDDASDAGITRDGTTVGTVDYMSPEQARDSHKANAQSDIYSLGCTWYHMLTGEPPFPEGSVANRLRMHAENKLPDPRRINPKVPAGIVAILNRMAAKNPSDRYASASELLQELEKANFQREKASRVILEALDAEDRPPRHSVPQKIVTTKSSAPPPAKPLPSRDPKMAPIPSTATIVLPYQLIGLILAGVATLIFAVYGYIQWGPQGDDNTAIVNDTVDLDDFSNPFRERADISGQEGDKDLKVEGDKKKRLPPKDNSGRTPKKNAAPESGASQNQPQGKPSPTETAIEDVSGKHVPKWALREISLTPAGNELSIALGGKQAAAGQVNLQQALKKLPPAGGIIKLGGPGPYLLGPIQIKGRQRVLMTAAKGVRPLIVLQPSAGSQSSVLDIENGTLQLQGIDFVVQQNAVTSDEFSAIHVSRGHLIVRHCSLITNGDSDRPTNAFQIESGPVLSGQTEASPARLLIEQSAILGHHLSAVSVETDSADVVIRDSLLYAGAATAVKFSHSQRSVGHSERNIHMISSTVVSRRCSIDLSTDAAHGPGIPTTITVVGSLFANSGSSRSAVLLNINNFLRTNGKFDHLTWISIKTAYQGWPRLIARRTKKKETILARDYRAWKTFWRQPGEESQFHLVPWPSLLPSQNQAVSLKPFSPESLPNEQARSQGDEKPGCRLETVSIGDVSLIAPPKKRPKFPQRPGWVKEKFQDARRVSVDLTKQDLGAFIRNTNLPERVTIVATGSGLRKITPFAVIQKSLRIEFHQREGKTPLALVPARRRKATAQTKIQNPDALITLLGGHLQLVNGNFLIPSTRSRANPVWFLDVVDGEFSLEHCHIAARHFKTFPKKGFVRWRRSANATAGAAAKKQLSSDIRDSFLVGGGPLIEARLDRQLLFMENTIFASHDDLFWWDIRNAATGTDSAVVMRNCTFSAAGTFFSIASTELPAAAELPLRIFADKSVFAAPMNVGRGNVVPVLMKIRQWAIAQKQISWIGKSNGYADEIGVFLDTTNRGIPPKQHFRVSWQNVWGRDHVLAPLVESGGVLFARPLPELQELTPASFALHQNAKGLHWGDNHQQIGAAIGPVEFKKTSRTARTEPKPKTNRRVHKEGKRSGF